jgi:hypothetical protein
MKIIVREMDLKDAEAVNTLSKTAWISFIGRANTAKHQGRFYKVRIIPLL